ncbi:MAG: hypothetical protein HOI23_06385 [Deltaproteobacteria bacterium]|nr:hypothetical protein [Deltaproteobacteria bacterium]
MNRGYILKQGAINMVFRQVLVGIGFLTLLGLCACTRVHPGIHVVMETTDNIARGKTRGQNRLWKMPVFLKPTNKPSRVIASFRGLGSANTSRETVSPDEKLWDNIKDSAKKIGANALLFRSRKIVECEVQGTALVATSYNAQTATVGGVAMNYTRNTLCIELVADALLVSREYDCQDEQNCRTERVDALELNAISDVR